MRHALVMLALAIRRASTLLPPPALRSSSTARFATDASRALERRFDAALRDDCGVRANDTVVAAVSGGVDSTCLLHLLARTPQSSLRAASKRCSRAFDASVAKRALRSVCGAGGRSRVEARLMMASMTNAWRIS